jgi:hypothetical protein
VKSIYALMLRENARAIGLMRKMGFEISYLEDGTAKAVLELDGEDSWMAKAEPSVEPAAEPTSVAVGHELTDGLSEPLSE